MRKQIIFTAIVSLCSFGMIDSAKLPDTKTTLDDLKTEKLIELKKQQTTKDSIIRHHNFELEKFF